MIFPHQEERRRNAAISVSSIIFAICLVVFSHINASAATRDFSDAPRSQWYGDAVYTCVEKGYVHGFEDGTFRPGDPITYAQLASMLRGGVYADTDYAKQTFSGESWWYPGIYTCRQMGALTGVKADVITGDSDVNTPVTRYEMAQVVSNVMASKGRIVSVPEMLAASGRISDWDAVPANYKDAVANCYALGIINGFEDGSFSGDQTLTRAQVCVVMVGMDEAIADLSAPAATTTLPVPNASPEYDPSEYGTPEYDADTPLTPSNKVTYTKANYPDLKNVGYGTYAKLDYQETAGKNTYFYDFRGEWRIGAYRLDEKRATYLYDNHPGFYGVIATAEKNVVTYTLYTELDNVTVDSAEFRTYDDAKYNVLKSDAGVAHKLDVAKLPNGPYCLCAWFDYKHADGTVETLCAWSPVYVSNGNAWFAKTTTASDNAAMEKWLAGKRNDLAADDAFQNWMTKHGGADLKAALRLDHITYPFYSNTTRYPNNTSKWQALAHEICPDDNATDFRKAYLLHEWMSHNLVYDSWVFRNDQSRYTQSGDYAMWNTHLGDCFDFSNVYAIMCRELGVPCRIIKDKSINHGYNAIYLNGRWEIVDLTHSCDGAYIENNKNAIQKFWSNRTGPGAGAQAGMGFLETASSMYKIYNNTADKYKTVEDRLGGLDTTLDSQLSTRSTLARFGGAYNH